MFALFANCCIKLTLVENDLFGSKMKAAEDQVVEDDASFQDDEVGNH